MKSLRWCFTLFPLFLLATIYSLAQAPTGPPCTDNNPPEDGSNGNSCVADQIMTGMFNATPLSDGSATTYWLQGTANQQIVSLYGTYGNSESTGNALTHYNQGVNTLAPAIVPRCTDGTIPPQGSNCQNNGQPPAIVFLFIGFSNCDIEICGGNRDAWDGMDTNQTHLAGQPCSTACPNLNNPNTSLMPWNQVTNRGGDGVTQQSFRTKSIVLRHHWSGRMWWSGMEL